MSSPAGRSVFYQFAQGYLSGRNTAFVRAVDKAMGGAVAVKSRPTDRLVRRRGTVLPGAKGGVANSIGGPTQARRGTGIDIGASDPVSRGTGAITEVVKIGIPNRLPRPAAVVRIVEGRVADVGADTGLGKRYSRD